MSQSTRTSRPKQPTRAELTATIDDLRQQLAKALHRADQAEAALSDDPTEATTPTSGACAEALLPANPSVFRLWAMVQGEAYRIRPAGAATVADYGTVSNYTFTKYSDGTSYTVTEGLHGALTCTCPGHTRYGANCNHGRGCRHVRLLTALRSALNGGEKGGDA
jgi:hypothetical protein